MINESIRGRAQIILRSSGGGGVGSRLRYIRYIRVGWEVGSCVIIRKATHKWFMSALEINLLMIARYISVQLIIIIIIIIMDSF